MDLHEERKENKKKLILSVAVVVLTLLSSLTIIIIAGALEMQEWLRVVLTTIGLVNLFGGVAVVAALEWNAGTYECRHCKKRFVPTFGAYAAGMHTLTTRYLKCPECGKKSWCKRRLTH